MVQVRSTDLGLVLPNDQDATGRDLGEAEIARLADVIRSGTLTSTKGTQVPELEQRFAALLGVGTAVACSSGTAAVHAAIAAIDPEPGAEIVTTSITDMGALAPILYQGAIPVFADVDPRTGNVTAASIADRALGSHRRDHGDAPVRQPVRARRDQRGRGGARDPRDRGLRPGVPRPQRRAASSARSVRVGCFSLQQGKQMTTGEGGLVVSDDPALARRIRLFVNKAWPYGEPEPDHEFLALNSRMNELSGAVANAQLDKLEGGIAQRIAMADLLTRDLAGVPGIAPPAVREDDVATWWKYALHVDSACDPRRSGRAGGRAPRRRDRVGAALHPEARVRVPCVHRAAHVR